MKHLMITTALVTATAFGAMAQTASDETSQSAVPAFLASDFTGKSLYTLDSDEARALSQQQRAGQRAGQTDGERDATRDDSRMSVADRDRMRWTNSETFLAGRDDWTDIGSINDIVMSMDGEIRGVLLDVGGFLGFATYTVMVDIEDLHFVTEEDAAEGIEDFFVVIAMSQEQLENLPEWDGSRLDAGFDVRPYRQQDGTMNAGSDQARDSTQSNMGRDTQAAVFGDDHSMLEGEERTADRLMGADVYDANGEHIGSVEDVVVDNNNRISDVLVDVGGFLGMGAHTVKLPIGDAQIGWNDRDDDVRVQVRMTADQLEDMPEHQS